MAVPKDRRTLSKVEFFYRAYRLNDAITQLLIKDFGIKRISKDLKAFTYGAKMTPADREGFMAYCTKYGINVETEYPLWIIEYYRGWILKILQDMINNITQANTIYPKSESEYYLRRQYQWRAIGNCYQLKQAMQAAVRNLPVKTEKYMPYIGAIEEEIALLKDWKKRDNKILQMIKEQSLS